MYRLARVSLIVVTVAVLSGVGVAALWGAARGAVAAGAHRVAVAALPGPSESENGVELSRQRRSPQGVTLGHYINYIASLIQSLPEYTSTAELVAAATSLRVVAGQLSDSVSYVQVRQQLRVALIRSDAAIDDYEGRFGDSPVWTSGTVTMLNRLTGLVDVLWDATAAQTDAELGDGGLDSCIHALQPLPN